MSSNDVGCSQRDLLGGSTVLLWILPAALIAIGALWPAARSLLWIPSFLLMGVSCLLNARRCGRLHCHLTGPLFLAGALLSVLDALDLVPIDWRATLAIMIIGTIAAFTIERVRGMYLT